MLTKRDREFAITAAERAEKLVGQVLCSVVESAAPSPQASTAAEVMVTAGLIKKFNMSLNLPNNFGDSVRAVLDQLNAIADDDPENIIHLDDIRIPDGPGDYVTLSAIERSHDPEHEGTLQ